MFSQVLPAARVEGKIFHKIWRLRRDSGTECLAVTTPGREEFHEDLSQGWNRDHRHFKLPEIMLGPGVEGFEAHDVTCLTIRTQDFLCCRTRCALAGRLLIPRLLEEMAHEMCLKFPKMLVWICV